jgi:hypothetical protein
MGLLDRAAERTAILSDNDLIIPGKPGFFNKASAFRENDPLETLCDERLARLPIGENAAYTALTILKACYPYDAALLVRKAEKTFSIYASLGIAANSSSGDTLQTLSLAGLVEKDTYTPVSTESIGLADFFENAQAILFPLPPTDAEGSESFLILIQRSPDKVSCASVFRVVKNNFRKFRFNDENKGPRPLISDSMKSAIDEAIAVRGGKVELVVLEFHGNASQRIEGFILPLIRGRIGNLGSTIFLGGFRALLVLKSGIDTELYAYQLSKALRKALSENIDTITIVGTHSSTASHQAFDFLASLA